MSGPVDAGTPIEAAATPAARTVELHSAREQVVGEMRVRRALPKRAHRTVGAWCFADHMGPASVTERRSIDIGPHPHIGLQTVTWLVSGEILHRDSLGSEQVVRAGQCNLMTAGVGVAHSEEATGTYRGELHGIQLWVAQPESTRHGPPAFEHHATLPRVDLGPVTATVIVGVFADTVAPARRDTDHCGVELDCHGGSAALPLDPQHEYALVVLSGTVRSGDTEIVPGALAYLGTGRDELEIAAREPARAMLLGGTPFGEELTMWWNFVARSRDEIAAARDAWETLDGRFGTVESPLARIPAPALTP